MVSNASEDLPEPEGPVMTVSARRGISRSRFLRLCWRAPRTTILSFMELKVMKRPALSRRPFQWTSRPSDGRRGPGARRHAIDPKQQQRTDDGEQDAPDGEPIQPAAGDHVPQEPTEERAHDTDEHRDQHPARILP